MTRTICRVSTQRAATCHLARAVAPTSTGCATGTEHLLVDLMRGEGLLAHVAEEISAPGEVRQRKRKHQAALHGAAPRHRSSPRVLPFDDCHTSPGALPAWVIEALNEGEEDRGLSQSAQPSASAETAHSLIGFANERRDTSRVSIDRDAWSSYTSPRAESDEEAESRMRSESDASAWPDLAAEVDIGALLRADLDDGRGSCGSTSADGAGPRDLHAVDDASVKGMLESCLVAWQEADEGSAVQECAESGWADYSYNLSPWTGT